MNDDIVRVRRYLLEQKFQRDDDEFEEYATAVVSIIGNEPLDEFEDCLAKLSYDYSPECWHGHIAGNLLAIPAHMGDGW